jgi:hypothetical protein
MQKQSTLLLSLALAVGVWVLVAAPASAHTLRSNNGVSAVLHIEPDDKPIAGMPITYRLLFQDANGAFTLANCACTATLLQQGKVLHQEALFAGRATVSTNRLQLPAPGAYTLRIDGKPGQGTAFPAFRLKYVIQATEATQATPPIPLLAAVGTGTGIGLVLLTACVMEYAVGNKRKHQRRKRG